MSADKKGETATGPVFKIVPEKLVINGQLDVQIHYLCKKQLIAYFVLDSFSFDLIRASYSRNGGKEEQGNKIRSNHFYFYNANCEPVDFKLTIKLTDDPDPLKKKWFERDEPLGVLKIDYIQKVLYGIEYNEGDDDGTRLYFPLILESENEKVVNINKKFEEFKTNQERRNRLRRILPADFAGEELENVYEEIYETVLQNNWQTMDSASDEELKKIFMEKKKEYDEMKEKEKRLEEEEKKKKEAEEEAMRLKEKKKKKKCCVII